MEAVQNESQRKRRRGGRREGEEEAGVQTIRKKSNQEWVMEILSRARGFQKKIRDSKAQKRKGVSLEIVSTAQEDADNFAMAAKDLLQLLKVDVDAMPLEAVKSSKETLYSTFQFIVGHESLPHFDRSILLELVEAFYDRHATIFSEKQARLIVQKRNELIGDNSSSSSSTTTSTSIDDIAVRRIQKAEAVLSRRTDRILIVIERAVDVNNVSAVLRTAECLGIQYVWQVLPAEWRRKRSMRNSGEDSKEIEGGAGEEGEGEEELPFNRSISKKSDDWLTIKRFNTTKECIDALRADGREIWATDLSRESFSLEDDEDDEEEGEVVESDKKVRLRIPPKLAIVFGRETDGVSKEMLEAADKRVYLPIHGFSESLNLSVATALVLQRLLTMAKRDRVVSPPPSSSSSGGADEKKVVMKIRGTLPEEEKKRLRKEWYGRLAKSDRHRELFAKYLEAPPEKLKDLRRLEEHRFDFVKRKMRKRMDEKEQEKERTKEEDGEVISDAKGERQAKRMKK